MTVIGVEEVLAARQEVLMAHTGFESPKLGSKHLGDPHLHGDLQPQVLASWTICFVKVLKTR